MDNLNSSPPGYHSVNPYLAIGDVREFVEFLKIVFNAVLIKQIKEDNGVYAEVRIGDTCIMIEEDHQKSHLDSPSLWVYVRDVDSAYEKALKVGCKSIEPPTRKYSVDKVAKVADPFGIMWFLATFNDKL
ncbi:VOC family protein [Candidatus Nitrosocosmicus sp. T]